MFAEEQSLATGLHLLMYGDHIICNPSSMLGNLGFTTNVSHFKELAEAWNVQVKFITKGANKMRLNRFEPVKQEDIAWMLDLLNTRVKVI